MVQKAVGIVGHGSRRTRRRFRAELASADESSNLRRGPVMRVDRVLDVSAVATRGAHMMPGVFEDAEDGTLRARDIFGRELPSSNAACSFVRKRSCGSARHRGRDFTRARRVVDVSRGPIVTIEPDRPVRAIAAIDRNKRRASVQRLQKPQRLQVFCTCNLCILCAIFENPHLTRRPHMARRNLTPVNRRQEQGTYGGGMVSPPDRRRSSSDGTLSV